LSLHLAILHLAVSLFYAWGLGNLVLAGLGLLWARRSQLPDEGLSSAEPVELVRALSVRLGMGLLVHALAIVAGLPLRPVLFAGAILAMAGLLLAGRRMCDGYRPQRIRGAALAWVALGLAMTAALSAVLVMDALSVWDARGVWFFQAKLIYYAGSLRADAGWREAVIGFSHPEYPKLLPILAASEMTRLGYWNEFFPKLALVPPLGCYVLALLAGPRGLASVGALCVTVIAILAGGSLAYNGYADVYVALPAAGALMAVLRWLRAGNRKDAEHAFVLLGLALATKEEARLFAVALAAGISPFILSRQVRSFGRKLVQAPASLGTLVLALAPALTWMARARWWGLHNYLRLDQATFQRMATRFHAGALRPITRFILAPPSPLFDASTTAFLGLLGVAVGAKAAAVLVTRRLQAPSVVCRLTGAVNLAALCLVYLITPLDFIRQIKTSADRVMLITFMCVLVFMGDALEDLERFTFRVRFKKAHAQVEDRMAVKCS
jgi:hypothetical protein